MKRQNIAEVVRGRDPEEKEGHLVVRMSLPPPCYRFLRRLAMNWESSMEFTIVRAIEVFAKEYRKERNPIPLRKRRVPRSVPVTVHIPSKSAEFLRRLAGERKCELEQAARYAVQSFFRNFDESNPEHAGGFIVYAPADLGE